MQVIDEWDLPVIQERRRQEYALHTDSSLLKDILQIQ